MAGFASVGCAKEGGSTGPSGGGATETTAASRAVEDVNVEVGASAEIADLTATVDEVHRQKSFGGVADAGYVVATVTVANESNAAQDYHRLQFRLEKPDGSGVNRTPVSGQAQLGEGELQPGQKVSGQLIFTVGEAAGRFKLTFSPRQDDSPERKRGVWSFDSQPGDAR